MIASVVQSLHDAINAGDVDAAIALFANEAVVTSGTGLTLKGKEEIRGYIEVLVANKIHAEVIKIESAGDKVTWTLKVTNKDSPAGYGALHEAIIQDGKIKSMRVEAADLP